MDVSEQTFWFNVCLQNNKSIIAKQGEIDILIRNLNRKIVLNSVIMPSLPLEMYLHYKTNSSDMINIKTKFYCKFANCKASYTKKHSLRCHQFTCKFNKQVVLQCPHCFINCSTDNGLKRHIEILHPETIKVIDVSLANSCLEKDAALVAEKPIPVIHEVCINMPNYERALIAFKCDFGLFMEFVNKSSEYFFTFDDVVSINNFPIKGQVDDRLKNVFQHALNHVGPKHGHVVTILENGSKERKLSVVETECLPTSEAVNDNVGKKEKSLSRMEQDDLSTLNLYKKESLPELKTPVAKKESFYSADKGRVVLWKGFDVNVSINSLLTQSKKHGKVVNILLHHKTNSDVMSFIEFEEKRSATSFVSVNPYKFSISKSYAKIMTRNQSTLVCLFFLLHIHFLFLF